MKAIVRILVAIAAVLLVAAGGYWLFQNNSGAQAAAQGDSFTQTVAVQRGDLSASISVVGELYAPQSETLRFDRISSATQIVSLQVQAGHKVQAGQTLATIDPAPYQQALDQARSDLQQAEKRLADLQTPVTELQIARADLTIARAELALQRAQDDLDDLLDPRIDDLQAAVADARLALAEAQARLIEVETDSAAADRLHGLRQSEAERSAEYSRLASESYSDAYHQDRLRVAYQKLLDAEDARITAEVQQQISLLRAQMTARTAAQRLADAEQALTDARDGIDEMDLAATQQALAQAETNLAAARQARLDLDAGGDAVALAAARSTVDRRRLAVADAEADLAAATLAAPFDGTILRTSAAAGDRVAASTAILTIANLDTLQVVAAIDEITIRQVAPGQAVRITFDAFPGQSFTGEVLSLPLQGTLQGGVMVYDVPISLQGAEGLPLLVGMTANAVIAVGQVENALLVPAMALQNVSGMYQVLVADNRNPEAAPQAVPVQIGLSDGMYTQIVRGLNDGDQVVVEMSSTQAGLDFRSLGQLLGGANRIPGGAGGAGRVPAR